MRQVSDIVHAYPSRHWLTIKSTEILLPLHVLQPFTKNSQCQLDTSCAWLTNSTRHAYIRRSVKKSTTYPRFVRLRLTSNVDIGGIPSMNDKWQGPLSQESNWSKKGGLLNAYETVQTYGKVPTGATVDRVFTNSVKLLGNATHAKKSL